MRYLLALRCPKFKHCVKYKENNENIKRYRENDLLSLCLCQRRDECLKLDYLHICGVFPGLLVCQHLYSQSQDLGEFTMA